MQKSGHLKKMTHDINYTTDITIRKIMSHIECDVISRNNMNHSQM